MPLSRTVCYP